MERCRCSPVAQHSCNFPISTRVAWSRAEAQTAWVQSTGTYPLLTQWAWPQIMSVASRHQIWHSVCWGRLREYTDVWESRNTRVKSRHLGLVIIEALSEIYGIFLFSHSNHLLFWPIYLVQLLWNPWILNTQNSFGIGLTSWGRSVLVLRVFPGDWASPLSTCPFRLPRLFSPSFPRKEKYPLVQFLFFQRMEEMIRGCW